MGRNVLCRTKSGKPSTLCPRRKTRGEPHADARPLRHSGAGWPPEGYRVGGRLTIDYPVPTLSCGRRVVSCGGFCACGASGVLRSGLCACGVSAVGSAWRRWSVPMIQKPIWRSRLRGPRRSFGPILCDQADGNVVGLRGRVGLVVAVASAEAAALGLGSVAAAWISWAVLAVWHGRHSHCMLPTRSGPPAARLMMWSCMSRPQRRCHDVVTHTKPPTQTLSDGNVLT